jgi:hypothetical protein
MRSYLISGLFAMFGGRLTGGVVALRFCTACVASNTHPYKFWLLRLARVQSGCVEFKRRKVSRIPAASIVRGKRSMEPLGPPHGS